MTDDENYFYVETGGLLDKELAFKIKRAIAKKFGIYAEVVDSDGDEVAEFEED